MKYIRKYKTINDYNADVEEEKLIEGEPYVSYMLSDLSSGDDVVFGIKEPPVIEPLTMWIDDFPDDIGLPEEYGYNTMEEYLENLVDSGGDDGRYDGANKYCFTGETIEYNGNTYYLWEMQGAEEGDYPYAECVAYALTETANFNELYNLSIENSSQNRNCPIYAFLQEDKSLYSTPNYDDENYVLLKVEKTNEE